MNATTGSHHHRVIHAVAGRNLKTLATRLAVYVVIAVLVLKLLPGLEGAVHRLAHVSMLWLLAALALEIGSETGYVLSWHAVIDPEDRLAQESGTNRMATRVAWAQLGGGTLVPAGSFGTLGVGGWLLSRFGIPKWRIAERELSLSLLNTAVDALALLIVGLALAAGILSGSGALELTLAPALLAGVGLVGALLLARRLQARSDRERGVHAKRSKALGTAAEAVSDVDRFLFHGVRLKSALGAVAFLLFDLLVLWTAFLGVHAHPFPALGIVVMAYIIGAFGGSLPFIPAGVGAVGGIAGMLILYGIHHDSAVAAVVVYQAVSLLVPLIGGAIAYLALRRHLDPLAATDGAGPLAATDGAGPLAATDGAGPLAATDGADPLAATDGADPLASSVQEHTGT
ncbi:MAG TPA: lysylphosphatidylglycerol synthase domain-containing protein [Solirubrobacteraceae bacterium]|nr:lysylphosphatidylglycerol synthase domain-containing protein [Solirubrobacteraceae bacterium]